MTPYQIDRERWAKMHIFDQMGNIYSEVGRSLKAKQNNDMKGCEQATIRAIDLFDSTIDSLIKQKSVRAKEVIRSKDQFLHAIYDENTDLIDTSSLEQYFLHFAIAARLNR